MAVFTKCPICGEFAFIQPELCDVNCRVFKCENGHTFKKKISREPKDTEIWNSLPEWAKLLEGIISG